MVGRLSIAVVVLLICTISLLISFTTTTGNTPSGSRSQVCFRIIGFVIPNASVFFFHAKMKVRMISMGRLTSKCYISCTFKFLMCP
jgi:hypothetical protein